MEISFSKNEIIAAIQQIDQNPNLLKGRHSSTYDLIYNGEKYPPILVLSVANKNKHGKELALNDYGNKTETPFKVLKDMGFKIKPKSNELNFKSVTENDIKIWIEKSIVKNRPDRKSGPRAVGKVLWSPRKGKKGADIYKNMRLVKENDIILHLIDNELFIGISLIKSNVIEAEGLPGTDWPESAYLVDLKNFIQFNNPIPRESILDNKHSKILNEINEESEVFYTNKLTLRQGAYLTPCPEQLLSLINAEYKKINGEKLPLIPDLPKSTLKLKTMEKLDVDTFNRSLKESGLIFNDFLIKRFISSILTKPLLILTGLSGSGKTKIAQAFTSWICQDKNQYKIIPVGADWTNREPLLGYPNALNKIEYVAPENKALDLLISAKENPNLPYFLILDEMNLSHVERYFADFLSAMESDEDIHFHKESNSISGVPSRIRLPKNLFIIGTVNIDETTHMFSPKVLDRANTIEFRITTNEMSDFLSSIQEIKMEALESKGSGMARSFLQMAKDKTFPKEGLDEINKELNRFFVELKKAGAEFGYRSATEILRLINHLTNIDLGLTLDQKLDIAIIQKLLPKLHGSRRKLSPILVTLAKICLKEGASIKVEEQVFSSEDFNFDSKEVKYPLSLEKIARMHRGAIENGFASFAEA